MKVLLVEDDEKLASLIARGLEEKGHQVEMAIDGETGLEKANSTDWDLILLDFMLPKKDGMAFLKEYDSAAPAPIIVLTASNAIENKIDCISTGLVVKYMEKPFDFEKLLGAMNEALQENAEEV